MLNTIFQIIGLALVVITVDCIWASVDNHQLHNTDD